MRIQLGLTYSKSAQPMQRFSPLPSLLAESSAEYQGKEASANREPLPGRNWSFRDDLNT